MHFSQMLKQGFWFVVLDLSIRVFNLYVVYKNNARIVHS